MTPAPVALMSCMRNEGIHLLEWLTCHRVIGFGPIVVCTNDCKDGSDRLLDLLARHGAVEHLPNPVTPGASPQDAGIRRAHRHVADSPAQRVAHPDSDESLNLAPGAAPVADLAARAGAAHAVALPWRFFGDNGHATWPGETLRAFTACETAPDPATVKFKSLYRFRDFGHASEHQPCDPRIPAPVAVNAAGEALAPDTLLGPPRARYHPADLALKGGAQVNHYATRSTDVFLLKNDRGLGTGERHAKYRLNGTWHRQANRNECQDRSILLRWPEVEAELARLRALPGMGEAEADCRAWFRTRAAALTPDRIREITKGAA
ncbi:glycosyltransferase family 2 protein [Tabrizicola flagellatus]|uniref:glycosyltransferase family 2 protein n=1 Tax=Tabrizicola flagellatus TaxID=2593021 RepID=UPI0011F2DFFF|nr:glycosyltransferase family 2 protein [Tabrizicola flagellatus]